MISPFIFITATIIMAFVQISIFRSLGKLAKILASIPLLAMLVNFGASSLILVFTGAATLVGLSNLASSIIFGIYVVLYKEYHGISIKLKYKKLLVYPVIEEKNPELPRFLRIIF